MKRHFKIEFFEEPKLELHYPKDFTFKQKHQYAAFGSALEEAVFLTHPDGKNVVRISTGLRAALELPDFISSISLFENGEILFLGPLIGIYTSGFTPKQLTPIGPRSDLIASSMSVHRALGAVPFLFGKEHIDWENGCIHGFFHTEEGWKKSTVPFPSIVMDRLPKRSSENRHKSVLLKQKFENDYLISWYHPGFFSQLELYEKLYNDSRAEQYLPETHPFISFSSVGRMLDDYGHVFLKGDDGHAACQLLYHPKERLYYCRLFDQTNKLLKFKSLEGFSRRVYGRKQLEKFLIQQGIRLIRKENKAVDFHVVVNHNNTWEADTIKVKYAYEQNGTSELSFEDVFQDEEERNKNLEKLKKAASEIASAIEDNIGGILTGMKLELGIDRDGRIWLLKAEENCDPALFPHPELGHTDYLTKRLAGAFLLRSNKTLENELVLSKQ
ncbi:hypothetical protein BLX87_14015 [Bacillus sp. VT-16-64]|nr:hypothetical protein BLX87_14015 [Bacillus sp. VT-16-64]